MTLKSVPGVKCGSLLRSATGSALLLAFSFTAIALFSGCAGKGGSGASGGSGDDQDFLNQLTLFVENIQADRIDRAMEMLSPEEKARFGTDPEPGTLPRRLGSLRLSTLAKRPGVRLGPKGLEGIYDELPQLGRSRPSEESDALPPSTEETDGVSEDPDSAGNGMPSPASPESETGSFEGLDESDEEVPLPMP